MAVPEIIVALDGLADDEATKIAEKLTGQVWGFKVNDMILEYGTRIIKLLRNYGYVFADPKIHDVPTTAFNSITHLVSAGANIVSVHASGGEEMLRSSMNAAKSVNSKDPTIIAGITTLTSLSNENVRNIYRGFPFQRFVDILKKEAVTTVVCSGHESEIYKEFGFKTICPGFRPFGALKYDDQKRISNEATTCDYIVVGRPVTQSDDPLDIVKKIKERLAAF